ncbi:MAG TPA: tetratricopeptide repeat protein [Candidatus Binatia bacterium]|nr:tetratricopeptide repeat protein [Candidatus Binatia bacterium]
MDYGNDTRERHAGEAPARAAVHLGVTALEDGNLDEAVMLLSLATEVRPEEVDGHVALGIAYERRNAVKAAIAALEKAVELDPGNFLAHLRLGDLYRRARRRPRSLAHLRAALVAARTAEERAVVRRALNG